MLGLRRVRRTVTRFAALKAPDPEFPSAPDPPSAAPGSMPGTMPVRRARRLDPEAGKLLRSLGISEADLEDDNVRELAAGYGFDVDEFFVTDDEVDEVDEVDEAVEAAEAALEAESDIIEPRVEPSEPRVVGVVVRVNLAERCDQQPIGNVDTFHGARSVFAMRLEARTWQQCMTLEDQKVHLLTDVQHGRRSLIAIVRVGAWSGVLEPCAPLRAIATDASGSLLVPWCDDVGDAIWLLLRDAR